MEKIKCKCHGQPLVAHVRDGVNSKPFRCDVSDFWCCTECGGLTPSYSKDFPEKRKFDCDCGRHKFDYK